MEISLSNKNVEIIINSLRNSRSDLKQQIRRVNAPNKKEICEAQLVDVEEVLDSIERMFY